jgi:hypothetical protein
MNRQMRIGFILWLTLCVIVIVFAIVYIIIGQIEANSSNLAQIINAIKTPHITNMGI